MDMVDILNLGLGIGGMVNLGFRDYGYGEF